ncbi:zinc metalloprotease [Rubrobacter aplysinae]|uniref:hypothetical protein n=1 Tax=Rubrobacter aplysinae TaxID=909625 RepID=UPI00064BBA9E|nr:hypothetical protein [Rubrobacter aplysinae]
MITALYLALIAAAVYLFAGPPLTLLHELGHALPLALAGQQATIYMGRPDPRARPTFDFGKVELRIRRPVGFGGECRYEEPERGFSPEGRLLVALGGPAASASATLVFGLGSYLAPDGPVSALLAVLAFVAFAQVLLAMIPIHYPDWLGRAGGKPSDGLRALWAMDTTAAVGSESAEGDGDDSRTR